MRKLNFDKIYFLYFNLFLFLALIISIFERFYVILGFTILTFFIFYLPYLLGICKKFVKLSVFEYFLVIFVYILIFFRSFEFYFFKFSLFSMDFIFRVLSNLFFSFVICFLGFLVLYFFVFRREDYFKLNASFFSIFIFCFSISFVTLIEIFRYFLNYVFEFSFFGYNLSGSLGFILVHFLSSFLISFISFLYLVGDDKHGFVKFF